VKPGPQAQQFGRFLESVRAKSSTPGLDLGILRDIVERHHLASTEPEGVTYAGLWCIPEGADPDRALPHFPFGVSVTASMRSDRKAAGHIAKAAAHRRNKPVQRRTRHTSARTGAPTSGE
jgi:epsilon-lactone hydrolase